MNPFWISLPLSHQSAVAIQHCPDPLFCSAVMRISPVPGPVAPESRQRESVEDRSVCSRTRRSTPPPVNHSFAADRIWFRILDQDWEKKRPNWFGHAYIFTTGKTDE